MSLAQLTIIGAGLIGGSLALGARNRGLASHIVAIDKAARPGQNAQENPFDQWIVAGDEAAVSMCLRQSSLVVLCVPVSSIIELLPHILRQGDAWVTDCGSTKAAICHSIASHPGRCRFIAGHPMAGLPQGGLENAQEALFQGRKWILCPQGSDPEGVTLVRALVEGLGAEVVEMSMEDHDESVAITSHVPQIIASALAVQASERIALRAAGPGFASFTRIAGGAAPMWRDIFETNGPAIAAALLEISDRLRGLGEQLRESESAGTLQILESARKAREAGN